MVEQTAGSQAAGSTVCAAVRALAPSSCLAVVWTASALELLV